MNILTSIIFVIIMLGVLASLHELGHYWVARLLKIKVFEVSLFVGPKLLRWKRKDVDFSVRLIPIGAYVRFSEIDQEGYVIESKEVVKFDFFVNQLVEIGVENALYMDMGNGWNHSFYRNETGEAHILHPKTHEYCTNWLVVK